MKYVCIKEFMYDKGIRHLFQINDKVELYDIFDSEYYRDRKIRFMGKEKTLSNGVFLVTLPLMYLPGRKFNKHFRSEAKLREDRINEILNG